MNVRLMGFPMRAWQMYFFLVASLMTVTVLAVETVDATVPLPEYYLYTVNAFDSSVASYHVKSGAGTVRHTGHRPTSKFPTTTIAHPSGRYLYVASKVIDVIETYRVDAETGRLTFLKNKTVSTGRAPQLFSIDPGGKFLYVALRFGGVGVYFMGPEDGTLEQVSGSPFLAGERTRTVIAHPNGRFVYASNAHSNSLSGYQINRDTGYLTPLLGSPFFAGDDTPVVPPDPMRDKPVEAGGMPFSVTIDASGQFLYVANRMGASLSAFRIDAESGSLSPLKGSPFSTCFDPYAAKAHPSEAYLYVLCYSPDTVAGYRINSVSGQLTPISDAYFTTYGEYPTAIHFGIEGKLAFVANYHTSDISVFNVDVKTGELHFRELIDARLSSVEMALISKPKDVLPRNTFNDWAITRKGELLLYGEKGAQQAIAGVGISADISAEAAGTVSVMHPVEPIIYVANSISNSISAFRIDEKTEQLTSLPGSPYPTGKSPTAIAIDTNGWYLYVVNQGSEDLSVFALHHMSGIPKEIPRSPLPVGKQPGAIAIDAASRYAYITNAGSETLSIFRFWTAKDPIIDNRERVGFQLKTGKKPVSVAVDYTGKFAYVVNADSKNLSIYQIYFRSGHLGEIASSPIPLKGTPVAVVAHPESATVYVATNNPGKVQVYRGLGRDGAVKEIQVKNIPFPELGNVRLGLSGRNLWITTHKGLLRCSLDAVSHTLGLCELGSTKPVVDKAGLTP